ncbi:MAG: hypothetical protein P1P82_09165 [Bacteroidales bacterium]|nr:hypothetical protein [Bacteroidales bacterium]MDT8430593.1 hypothetical protein [Bacteroidales bacterium]
MVRKFRNIMVMCLLLISTTGFSVSEHFCDTMLVSVHVNKEAEPCCDTGNCCHSDISFYQLDEDFVATANNFNTEHTYTDELNFVELFTMTRLFETEVDNLFFSIAESPPPLDRDIRLSTLQQFIL